MYANMCHIFPILVVLVCTYFVVLNHEVLNSYMQDASARERMHFRASRNTTIMLHVNISGNLTLTSDEENIFFEYNTTPAVSQNIPDEIFSKLANQSSSERVDVGAHGMTNSTVKIEEKQQVVKKSVLTKDPYSHFKPMLVIPSEEGLISQYLRVTGFLEKAKEYNRSLVLFPFISHHYSDIAHSTLTSGGRIHLCDIFYFPYNLVTCYHTGKTPVTISSILADKKCSPYQFNDWMKSHPDHFGLDSFEGLYSLPFDFSTSECVIIGTQGGPKKWTVEIKFTYKYNELLKIALESLKRIRIERTSGLYMRAHNVSTESIRDNSNMSKSTSGSKNKNVLASNRRRLNSWLDMVGLKGVSKHFSEKNLSKSESIPPTKGSTKKKVSSVENDENNGTPSPALPSSISVLDSSEGSATTTTSTYQYYLNFTNNKARDIERSDEGMYDMKSKAFSPSSVEKKLYKEMIEPGGQKVEMGTKVANHSAGLSYSRFISEHKNQSGFHRLHYRDHDSFILRGFDEHFNMSDLPPSEEEFLALSKESSHIPNKVFIDEYGRRHDHSGISTDTSSELFQHDAVFNGSHIIHTTSSLNNRDMTRNTSSKSPIAELLHKLKPKGSNQVHEANLNFSVDKTLPIGSTIEKINFIVAHWRRGDQLTSSLRCRSGLDNSVNCGSVQNFMREMNESIRNITKYTPLSEVPIVYICTNEESANSIFELKRNNYILYHDLVNYASNEAKARKLASLNSLERFILESQLMIYSTHFVYFGITSIHPFVKHGRIQLQERLKKLLKIKSGK